MAVAGVDLAADLSAKTDQMPTTPAVAKQLQAKCDAWAKTLKDPSWPCEQEGSNHAEAE